MITAAMAALMIQQSVNNIRLMRSMSDDAARRHRQEQDAEQPRLPAPAADPDDDTIVVRLWPAMRARGDR